MKPNIHPKSTLVLAKCVCGNEFTIHSAMEANTISMEVCNKCHPFYTGKQQTVVAAGRVESFNNKFIRKPQNSQLTKKAEEPKESKKPKIVKSASNKVGSDVVTATKKPSKKEK